jgi:hypothetical protein
VPIDKYAGAFIFDAIDVTPGLVFLNHTKSSLRKDDAEKFRN